MLLFAFYFVVSKEISARAWESLLESSNLKTKARREVEAGCMGVMLRN